MKELIIFAKGKVCDISTFHLRKLTGQIILDFTGIYELLDSLLISVKVSNSLNLILGVIYQLFSSGINIKNYVGSFGVNILEKLRKKNIILTGDFNIDLHGDISNLGSRFWI